MIATNGSFGLVVNGWLAFWLFLVASSYFLLRRNVKFFGNCRVKPAEKVCLPDRTIPNERTENHASATGVNSKFSCLESSQSFQKCDAYSDISDLDRASYWDSLISLEEEDTEWLSDSKPLECSFESPSTPLGNKCDSLSDSRRELWDGSEELDSEPLFWPFEEELNWNSEETWSSFCPSPRRRLVFDSRSPTSRIKECKQEGHDAVCSVKSKTSRLSMWSKSSAKIVPLECEEEKVVLESREALSNKLLSLNNTFLAENFASNNDLPLGWEYIALDQELPIETLVGLKEFDGHEGLDSEFNGYVFMLDWSLSFQTG